MISPEQIKAARALLGLGQAEICDAAGISIVTLRRIESRGSYANLVTNETVAKVQHVLEEHGATFLKVGDPSPGPGVALRLTETS
jgi:transcriptional regulator with XRE-family HTH domain